MFLLETANNMFLSFVWFELLSFEHGNPISHKIRNIILWLRLLGFNQVFFHPEVLDFLPIYFSHILVLYLESLTCFHGKDLIVQSLYVHVHLKNRKAGWR